MARGKKGKKSGGKQPLSLPLLSRRQHGEMLCTDAASESDEDGLPSYRTDPDELAEDLDALIDVLCVGATPAWHAAPALAADLVFWFRHGEIPTLRTTSDMAVDLDMIPEASGPPSCPPSIRLPTCPKSSSWHVKLRARR